jgi:mono/diheme cytochrome c family protein
MFLPEAWGCGYAAEACAAALHWFAGALPSEPVVLCTQIANDRSMRLAAKQGFTNNQQAVAGAKLFAVAGCLNCHTYLGVGGGFAGAPDLTAEGAKNKGIAFQIAHLKCPACKNAGSPMPSFAGLGDTRLKQLAAFLEASKGKK